MEIPAGDLMSKSADRTGSGEAVQCENVRILEKSKKKGQKAVVIPSFSGSPHP